MRGILDTSVVVADDVEPLPGYLALSSITVAELHFGVLVARSADVRAERLRRLLFVEKAFESLPVDDAVAASYGRVAAAVREAGRQPRSRSLDLLIAATALAHDARIYTRNAADFVGLEGLVEIIPA
ncbi:type II toxin-antitoxin system VapC family toxin [Gordonia sp. ABSL11-1]|uniref:type II toxin-antitoxin system VapC family toxin n=1 Tax=Gordonia sp. ABSL11-1 TaxID=3053924 RepID=UPI002572E636|nr:type II toxin-antitoxin system VapC family toxin [Gordonia sp. ABSL11-1]MDL9947447.1 type II toxin-antitoxin system VapC family toxin [Gordonia sp. ABSL11-1]